MTNATLISKFGVTPGKWLLGIRVLDENRSLLKFPRAFIRELGILLLGLTAGLVVVSPLVIAFTYLFLKLKGVTPWDRIAMATSEFENISVGRLMVMFPAFLTLSIFWKFLTGIILTDIR